MRRRLMTWRRKSNARGCSGFSKSWFCGRTRPDPGGHHQARACPRQRPKAGFGSGTLNAPMRDERSDRDRHGRRPRSSETHPPGSSGARRARPPASASALPRPLDATLPQIVPAAFVVRHHAADGPIRRRSPVPAHDAVAGVRRPDVPERVRAAAPVGGRCGPLLPQDARRGVAVVGADGAAHGAVRQRDQELRGTQRDRQGVVPPGRAQGRADAAVPAPVVRRRGRALHRPGAGEGAGAAHGAPARPQDRGDVSVAGGSRRRS